MTNADLFRAVFNGLMATELWAKPESEFLEWLNAEAVPNETFSQEPKQVVGIADSLEGMEVGYCPSCNRAIVNKKIDETKFCRFCGQAVKWNVGREENGHDHD